ncbi:MAG TPA: hypothetical protein VIH61_00085 [Waddliaceae bacterium]
MGAINQEDTKNTLFGNCKNTSKEVIVPQQPQRLNETATGQKIAKYQNYDKVTALLTPEQKLGLDRVVKRIMKHRASALKGSADKERITANTLLRALIEHFLKSEPGKQMDVLACEEDVYKWITKLYEKE